MIGSCIWQRFVLLPPLAESHPAALWGQPRTSCGGLFVQLTAQQAVLHIYVCGFITFFPTFLKIPLQYCCHGFEIYHN